MPNKIFNGEKEFHVSTVNKIKVIGSTKLKFDSHNIQHKKKFKKIYFDDVIIFINFGL